MESGGESRVLHCGAGNLARQEASIDHRNRYSGKLISPEAAAGLVKSGMWVHYGYSLGFPRLMDEMVAQRSEELHGVKIRAALAENEPQVLRVDPFQDHFIYSSFHLSSAERRYHDRGCCSYIPSSLGEIPRMYRDGWADRPDIAFVQVTPMNEDGHFNFGAAIAYEKALCDSAGTVVLEVNESQPWVNGGRDEVIHISEVDYVVENRKYDLAECPESPVEPEDELIAAHIADRMEDGSTIELGIGGIPTAIANLLIESRLKDLGIHSGSITDGVVDLIQAGIVTCTFIVASSSATTAPISGPSR